MIRIRLSIFIFLFLNLSAYAQSIKGYTQEEIDGFSEKVEDQVRFLEYLLNTVGNEETPARDRDVIIRESYLKIFRDGQVQVEDDLVLDRLVVTNKDITAYMKDIEFFYQNVSFKFKVREVKSGQKENGDVFFLVSLDRTITAKDNSGKEVSDTKERFVEINLEEKSQELKIVSIYTTKLSRDEELLEWWEVLDPHWKAYFETRFEVGEFDSVNLDLIYKFVSVDSLNISGTDSLLDLNPLQALRELKFVDLSKTQITQLGPLSNVTFLESLDISETPASEIQFIKYSDRLKHLNISKTQIQDISELVNLKALETLSAVETPITSFAVVNEFQSLRKLNLEKSGFNNTENIQALDQLEDLNLSNNYVVNFSLLSELKSLVNLNLSGTNIQDLSPLSGLDKLEIINITNTPVRNITALNGKVALVKVLADQTELSVGAADTYIRANPEVLLIHHVKDLETWWERLSEAWKSALMEVNPRITNDQPSIELLSETTGIEELNLVGMGLQTLTPITRFVKLRQVDFSDNPIDDLLPLSEVGTLEELVGKNAMVQDLSALKGNDLLTRIDLEGNPVKTILDILALPELAYLNVNNSAIFTEEVPEILIQRPDLTLVYRVGELTDWWGSLDGNWKQELRKQNGLDEMPTNEELHRLTSTANLVFDKTGIDDLNPIQAFVNLRKLVVFDAPLWDISPIKGMSLLKSLTLSQMPVSDFSAVSNLFQLEELDISNTGIEDLEYLSKLTQLKKLNLSGTNLKNLKGLESLVSLEELDVASTNLRSLKPLEGLQSLKKLSCFNTRLSSRSVDSFKESNPDCEVRYY